MTVHRTRPLPALPASGHLVVAEVVIERTRELLLQTPGATPHEAVVWWLGRHADGDTVVLACHEPPARSGPQFVRTDEAAAGTAARAARKMRLGVVAQIHSHPGADTRHSDGDDDLVLMPYEGMFSLVVARYGEGSLLPSEGAGLHQFQNGRWILVRQKNPALLVVPSEVTP